MEFDSLIKKRKSVRSFKPKKASWKEVLEAVDAANQGPFAGNMNNIKFVIVENTQTIKEIAKHSHQTWIAESGIVVVVCSDETHIENKYGERGRIYTKQQAGAAIATLWFKLVDLGLCACWVGAFTDEMIRSALDIPSHINIEAIIPIGCEKAEKPKAQKEKKKPLEATIFWERWDNSKRPTFFEETRREPEYET